MTYKYTGKLYKDSEDDPQPKRNTPYELYVTDTDTESVEIYAEGIGHFHYDLSPEGFTQFAKEWKPF